MTSILVRSIAIGAATNRIHSPYGPHILNSGNYPIENKETSNCILYLTVTLVLMIIILMMAPDIVRPPALYIALIFTILTIIFIVRFIDAYMKSKAAETSTTTGANDLSIQSPDIGVNSFYDIDGQSATDGQSQNSAQALELPPKYELPPSYSQTMNQCNV